MTTVNNIDDVRAQVEQYQAGLGDGRDCATRIELAEWDTTYRTAQRVSSNLRNLPADIAKYDTQLADAEAERAAVVAKQTELEQAILDAPEVTTIGDARERDREHARQQHLQRQLVRLADGTLLRAPGVAYPRLSDLDGRIAELRARRDRARQALESYRSAAETLLAAPTAT